MGKKCNKPKSNTSKRVRLKTKYSIKKKVKEHNKKMNREARKISNLGLPHRKHDNDQRLPNSYPFKAQVIEAAEARQVYEKELKTTLRA
jgi:nuclear GTP-binding protein